MGGSRFPNPYAGPRPLELGETLYGRDRELDELYYLFAAERVVLLHSPSGAGKSSLVQAGLIPRLRRRFDVWRPTRVNQEPAVGETARGPVNRYVLSALRGFEEGIPENLRGGVDELAGQTLAEYFEARPKRPAAPENVVVIFDQFEEVLTVDPLAVEARREFFGQLGELLRDPRVWALMMLREDYLAPLDPYARLVPTHLKNRFRLDLLGLEGAREAIVRPALAGGRRFPRRGTNEEFPAAEQLVRDLATTQAAGGDTARERAVRDWFGERLITAGGIRGQVPRGAEASGGLANEIVERLLDTHLVRAEARAGTTWYELAHDRLIEPVRGDNAAWHAEHLSEVQQRAALWERQGRPPGLLERDAELAAAERWAADPDTTRLTEIERRFLDASRRAQDVLDRDRRQARRIRRLAVAAVAASVAAALVGLFAFVQWRGAERQRAAAENLTRAAVAAHLLDEGETAAGNLLLLEVRRPDATPTALAALHRALADPVEAVILEGHDQEVRAAVLSPDGERVLTTSRDDTARVWDADTGEILALLEGHGDDVETAAWSPDGRRAATGSRDTTARIWDTAGGAALHVLEGHTDPVLALAWDPDGRRLATFSPDTTVRVWDAESGTVAAVLHPGGAPGETSLIDYLDVAWSPDGRRLAVNLGRDVHVWTAFPPLDPPGGTGGTGEAAAVFAGHGDDVLAFAWSPDGHRLATAAADGTARIWETGTAAVAAVLEGHRNWVVDVAWSPDGRRLATASHDTTARVWDAATGESTALLEGHGAFLWSVSWSPSPVPLRGNPSIVPLRGNPGGEWLATSSEDTTARLWRPSGGPAVAVLAGHGARVRAAAWDPAGERLLTVSEDAAARIWKPFSIGEEIATLWDHGDFFGRLSGL